jgi:hypothetical protein
MKTITLLQAGALLLLAVIGAAYADEAQAPCDGLNLTQSCVNGN